VSESMKIIDRDILTGNSAPAAALAQMVGVERAIDRAREWTILSRVAALVVAAVLVVLAWAIPSEVGDFVFVGGLVALVAVAIEFVFALKKLARRREKRDFAEGLIAALRDDLHPAARLRWRLDLIEAALPPGGPQPAADHPPERHQDQEGERGPLPQAPLHQAGAGPAPLRREARRQPAEAAHRRRRPARAARPPGGPERAAPGR